MLRSRAVEAYLIPGVVFQSVAIAGGYGTGREVMQFFTSYGSLGGLYGFTAATLSLALLLGVSYEFARRFRVYDYRSFLRRLIGPFWPAFELLYLGLFLLVLAVIGSASGSMLSQHFGVLPGGGLLLLLASVGALSFFGRALLARVMTLWSAALYAVFVAYFVLVLREHGAEIAGQLRLAEVRPGWLVPGLRYALYSSAIIPAVLFSTRGIRTTREALWSGALSALICQLPGYMFHVSFLARPSALAEEPVPVFRMIGELGAPWLMLAYTVVLLGTFVETGAGFVQGVNERLDAWRAERHARPLPRWVHAGVAIAGLLVSSALSRLGIITLIGRGYTSMAWGFLLVYVAPLLSVGLYRLRRSHPEPPDRPPGALPEHEPRRS